MGISVDKNMLLTMESELMIFPGTCPQGQVAGGDTPVTQRPPLAPFSETSCLSVALQDICYRHTLVSLK